KNENEKDNGGQAITGAEAGPNRLVGKEIRVEQAEGADDQDAGQLDGTCNEGYSTRCRGRPGERNSRDHVDHRRGGREQVRNRRLVELRRDLHPGPRWILVARSPPARGVAATANRPYTLSRTRPGPVFVGLISTTDRPPE